MIFLPMIDMDPNDLSCINSMLKFVSSHAVKHKCTAVITFDQHEAGLHVCRLSDNLWAGLSVDLVIERCLMRSVKTTGGLTRGRGMSEIQRLVWVLSTPACAYVNEARQDFTKVHYTTSNQYKDRAPARMARDESDFNVLVQYLL